MAQGGTQWGPGNFGFLDQLGNGANGVAEALASNSLLGKCQQTVSVTTETGNILNAVRNSLNMRFDFDPGNASACKNAPCSASSNVIKDVAKPTSGNKTCQNWAQLTQVLADVTSNLTPPRYFPRSNGALPTNVIPQTMGPPRDICHYFQNCKRRLSALRQQPDGRRNVGSSRLLQNQSSDDQLADRSRTGTECHALPNVSVGGRGSVTASNDNRRNEQGRSVHPSAFFPAWRRTQQASIGGGSLPPW